MTNSKEVDDYISKFPEHIQIKLKEIRSLIINIVPQAEELISYQIPTYKLKRNLVHFGGFKNHIGFYPTPSGIKAFEEELQEYKYSKGSINFPIDQPLPRELIEKIIRFRVKEESGH